MGGGDFPTLIDKKILWDETGKWRKSLLDLGRRAVNLRRPQRAQMKDLRILTILDGKPMSDKYVERHAKAAAKQRAFSN